MAEVGAVSSTADPYAPTYYNPGSNEKNTLTITSYFKLLAAQLANQDMSNPMDNSEMMAQMVQMAMVQSLSAMTESVQTSTAVSTQTYAAGLIGQEITVAITKENENGTGSVPSGVKYGIVESVDFTTGTPVFKLQGDDKKYPLSYVLGMGKIDDPYASSGEEDGKGDGDAGAAAKLAGNSTNDKNSNPLYDPTLFM
ncbi:flagellar hook capping protein [Clostridiaceae bacterium]|jgi:flagellar basal-body rod modification protein FlgD|nr:flagellar hook capping protein [Clostridium sp.]NBI69920.1 flagellar hook capping protein [Clostridiaceae bacterium]